MSQNPEHPGRKVTFLDSHAQPLQDLNVLKLGENNITPHELLERARAEKKYDEVICWVSQELANGTMTNLMIAQLSLTTVEEALEDYSEDKIPVIVTNLQTAQEMYDKIIDQAPLLRQSYDLLKGERDLDSTLPQPTESMQYYIDKVPQDAQTVTELTQDLHVRLDRIDQALSNL